MKELRIISKYFVGEGKTILDLPFFHIYIYLCLSVYANQICIYELKWAKKSGVSYAKCSENNQYILRHIVEYCA